MLDKEFIFKNLDKIQANINNRNLDIDLSLLIKLDKKRKDLILKIEKLRKGKKENAQMLAQNKDIKEKEEFINKGKLIKAELTKLEPKLETLEKKYNEILMQIPNITHETVPIGKDETGNVVIRKVGEPKKFEFNPKEHWELAENLGLLDLETAAKVTGARFSYLKNDLVLLQFALINLVLSIVTDQNALEEIAKKNNLNIKITPFIPIIPPVMIKPEVLGKMGRLEPKEERYYLQNDDLYLAGSAEHTLGPMHMNSTLKTDSLPLRYIGYSTAFRREAGSYGKDLKGIFRVHQFDKLEFESFTLPEDSIKEQDFLIAIQEHLMQLLEIPYQVIFKCTGDMGLPDYREFDIEAWLPGQNKYRETHTSDLMTDYQSRRLGVKYARAGENTNFVHMNDATVLAIGRTLIAILENYQNKDGSISIPKILHKFLAIRRITK